LVLELNLLEVKKMNDLKSMSCIQPKKGGQSLSKPEIEIYRPQIPDWDIIEIDGVNRLVRQFRFKNFVQALEFTNRIGELAEQEDHHPSILTEWGKVTISWWTHAVEGLHLNDLISAAKSDQIYLI
jgi:4a-hydroxytetrahydrobiopterin dehydratase